MAGIDAVHVPYKGSPPGVNDVIAGQVHFMLNSLPTHRAAARESGKDQGAGRLEREAFGRGAGDSHDRRDSPGLRVRRVVRHDASGRHAAGVNKVSTEMAKMMADPPFARRLFDLGAEPQASTPAELAAFMRKDSERWARLIRELKAVGTRFE